jgi:very-short-patch-repair endonuclease
MIALCKHARLPLPECNVWIEGMLVDAVWRAQQVVLEVDGRDGHRSWGQTVRDRRRDLTLRGVGITVLRYVWDQLEHEAKRVEADLARALDLA